MSIGPLRSLPMPARRRAGRHAPFVPSWTVCSSSTDTSLSDCSRHRLANLLWGDRQDEQARASLRQTLAALRRERISFGIFAIEDGSISLDQAQIGTDVGDLDRLRRSATGGGPLSRSLSGRYGDRLGKIRRLV